MTSRETMGSFAAALKHLQQYEAKHSGELDAWYAAANELKKKIDADSNLQRLVPHFFWHYISDADVRLRDPEYRKLQLGRLNEMIASLERGEVPFTNDTVS